MKRSRALIGLFLALGSSGALGGCQSAAPDTAALKASLVFSHDAPSRQQIERGLRDGEVIGQAAQEIAAAQRRSEADVRQELQDRLQVSFKPGAQRELAIELRCKEEGLDEDYAKSWGRAAGLINALAERYVNAERAQREAGLRKQVFLARQKVEQAETALRAVDNASLKGELAAAGAGAAEAQGLRQQIAALVADSGDPFNAKRAEKLRDRLAAIEGAAAPAPQAGQAAANPAQVAQARAEYERARQRLAQAQAALDADIQGRWLQLTATAPVKPVEKPTASSVATRPFFEDQK